MDVLFRDPHLLIVNKPSGLLTHRGWAGDRDNALVRARNIAGAFVYPAHRLDRATSGVLVFALSQEVASGLGAQLEAGGLEKCYLALVRGKLDAAKPPLVRVHPIDTLSDLLGIRDPGRTWTLRDAMQRIAKEGSGIVIVLRDHSTPRELADAVSALGQHLGHAAPAHAAPQVLRTYGIGAQILKDLGVTRMQVLSTPKQLQGISAFGLEITGYVAD